MAIVRTNDCHYTAIANSIREKTGEASSYKPSEMAAGVDAVYDAGKQAQYDAFWDAVQSNGTRTDYVNAFQNWGNEYIRPKYKVIPTYNNLGGMFGTCRNLKKIESAYFDFSQLQQVNAGYLCNGCSRLLEFEDIGLFPSEYSRIWQYCDKLHTIAVVYSNENTTYVNAFNNCKALENITIDGVIGQNGFNVSTSPLLTHDSLMSIINALQTKTSGTWTVSLGTANLAKLTDGEKAMATQKGWTLA